MKSPTRRTSIVIVAVAIVASIVAWRAFAPAEPVYQGRKLSSWFNEIYTHPQIITQQGVTITNPENGRKEPALEAIASIGSNAVPFLMQKLSQKDNGKETLVRQLAQRIPWPMARFYLSPRAVIQDRFAALRGLAYVGPAAREAVPLLITTLEDRKLKYCAIITLGKIGPDAEAAVPALCQILQHETDVHELIGYSWRGGSTFRRLLLQVLGEIGPGAQAAIPTLISDLDGYSARMRAVTNYAPLMDSQLKPQRALQLALMEKVEKNNHLMAALALWRIAPSYQNKVVPVLIESLEGEEFWDDMTAVNSTMKLPGPLPNRPPGGRLLAAQYLGEIGASSVIPVLENLRASDDERLREEAGLAIKKIKIKQGERTTP